MKGKAICTFFAIIYTIICFGQSDTVRSYRSFYFQPEILAGMLAPDYEPFPSSGPKETMILNVGSTNVDNKPWAKYYNHPDIGFSVAFSQLGNQTVFGDEIDAMPYITFNTSRRLKNAWYFKIGIGASYFTKHFDSASDPLNLDIGSSVTWAFKVFIYRDLWVTKKFSLRIGGGYCHSSDGHTQLPNVGLNSGLLGISAQFRKHSVSPDYLYPEKIKEHDTSTYFLQDRAGIGMHARGGPFGPAGSAKYGVFSDALSGGFIWRKHLKLRAGFTYRDYGQLMDYTGLNYSTWQVSNIFFSLGCEFLVGHVGMDIEGGINLYKPFYYTFYQKYEGSTTSMFYYLKSIFPMRLGLNYYFIDPAKNTRCNIYAGAHIDANFGQADFSELSFGCSMKL